MIAMAWEVGGRRQESSEGTRGDCGVDLRATGLSSESQQPHEAGQASCEGRPGLAAPALSRPTGDCALQPVAVGGQGTPQGGDRDHMRVHGPPHHAGTCAGVGEQRGPMGRIQVADPRQQRWTLTSASGPRGQFLAQVPSGGFRVLRAWQVSRHEAGANQRPRVRRWPRRLQRRHARCTCSPRCPPRCLFSADLSSPELLTGSEPFADQ